MSNDKFQTFSNEERGRITKLRIEVEYPDGSTKVTEMNPIEQEIEGIFWSDRLVKEVMAEWYKNEGKTQDAADLLKMWEPGTGDRADNPTVILKQKKCIPTCNSHKCP